MDKRSKEGFANILTMLGICLIIGGIVVSITVGLENGVGAAFLLCLTGTVLNFYANYMRNGYLKFFN